MRHVKFVVPIVVLLLFASGPAKAEIAKMPVKAAPAKAVISRPVAVRPLPVPKSALELPSFPTSRVKRMFGGTEAQRARGWLRALSYLSSDLNFFFGSSRFHDFETADFVLRPSGVPERASEPVAHEINGRIVTVYGSQAEIINRLIGSSSFLNDAIPMSETSRFRTFTEWLKAVKVRCIANKDFHVFLEGWAGFHYDDCPRIQSAWEVYLAQLVRNGQTPPQDDSGNTITRWSDYCDLVSRGEGQLRDIFADKSVEIGGTDPRPIEPPVGTLL
jgi:hypothetical protein